MVLCSKLPSYILGPLFLILIIVFCLSAEAYIEGPWLWMIAKGEKIDDDQLAVASKGALTENLVAEYGINEGDTVGRLRWTRGRLRSTTDCLLWVFRCSANNVNELVNEIGLSTDRGINYYAAYAAINIVSPRDQRNVAMGVGSDDSVKVWLNGDVVHVKNVRRSTTGIQDHFRVDLKTGDNLLLVKVTDKFGHWGLFFDIYLDGADFTTELPTGTPGSSLALQMLEKYSDILEHPDIREAVPRILTELQKPEIQRLLTPFIIETVVQNPALLGTFGVDEETIGFIETHGAIRSMFRDPDFQILLQTPEALSEFEALVAKAPEPQPEDVDRNGVVNIQDLVLVAERFGQTGQNAADVNADGVVDVTDLVRVAGAIAPARAAPSRLSLSLETLTPTDIRRLLMQAQQLDVGDPAVQNGIAVLQRLLRATTPSETALLPNYPNPFNPETWIPYQLPAPAEVTVRIYAGDGHLIRTLALGHQLAGVYQSKSRAAYWDGKNEFGEPVASGIYFYSLTAGDFTATRKMVIRK